MGEKKKATARLRKTPKGIVLKQKERFAKSDCLEEAFFMVNGGINAHDRFVHYTTLSSIENIFTSRRWWLTHSTLGELNDVQEAKKFGNHEILKRMYQASFSYGSAESAAMWGLYCTGNPSGVMISISGKAMREWFEMIRGKKFKACLEYKSTKKEQVRQVELTKRQIECADARDVIYASTDFADASSRGKNRKNRSHVLRWFDVRTMKIEDLAREINIDKFTGWIKDAEWWQENESRIAVRVKNVTEDLPENLSIDIPDSVLKSMRFTLSPWLREGQCDEFSSKIRALVMRLHDDKLPRNIVAPSVLTGALESWRDRCRQNSKEV